MPKPNKKESEKDYIQRCMSDKETVNKYPDQKQRYAVCSSMYNNAKAEEVRETIKADIKRLFKGI